MATAVSRVRPIFPTMSIWLFFDGQQVEMLLNCCKTYLLVISDLDDMVSEFNLLNIVK